MITDTIAILDRIFELFPKYPNISLFAAYYTLFPDQYDNDKADGTLLINIETNESEITIDDYQEYLRFIERHIDGNAVVDFNLFDKLMKDESTKPMIMYPELSLDDSFKGFTLEHFIYHCFCLKTAWPEEHEGTLLTSGTLLSTIKNTLIEAFDTPREGKFRDVGPWLLVNIEESLERVRTEYNSLINGMEGKTELDTDSTWTLFMLWILVKAEFCRRVEEEENL